MQDYIFNDDKKSIRINRTDLPTPWINYISNGTLHGFVSQVGGGMLWLDNPAKGRISRYRKNNLPIDSPGFYIYIRESDGSVWSPTFRPTETPLDCYYAEHMAGKSVFHAEKNGTKALLTLFIAPDTDVCIWKMELCSNEDKHFDVFAYMELSQRHIGNEFSGGYYWRHMLNTWFDEKTQSVQYLFHPYITDGLDKVPLVYLASNRDVVSFSGDRDAFCGNYRTEKSPVAVEKGICGNEEIQSGEPCAALHIKVDCKKGVKENVNFYLGAMRGGLIAIDEAREKIAKELMLLRTDEKVREEEEKLDKKWNTFLSKFECSIPDKNAERQINVWGPIASMHTARYSRSVNVEAPGTRNFGYRDSCQDMFAITYRDSKMAEDMLIRLLAEQFESGKAIHCEGTVPDAKTRCDDHLWLAFLVHSLVSETGNKELLYREVPYLAENAVSCGNTATVWEHLKAAVNFTENNLGAHGLPLTFKGDWNDIIFRFSQRGKGESVFAAQQYCRVLELMIELADFLKDTDALENYRNYLAKQRENVSKHAWNGKWFYRCFDDDGNAIGSEADEFAKIWLNPQSWAVIGNTGTKEMQRAAMDAAKERLDTNIGMMLLAPGFKTWPEVKDPFHGYNPGTGENGAVFCHAHTWTIVAEAMLGNAENAWKYYNDLVPHNALQHVGIERYKSEPYSWCSNIVGFPNNKQGWGNVAHISGTVAWMNVAATQYLLGIRPALCGIVFDPCIPSAWDGFKVKREFRGCMLDITVENSSHVEKGVRYIIVDGERIEGGYADATLFKDGKNVTVTVVMG